MAVSTEDILESVAAVQKAQEKSVEPIKFMRKHLTCWHIKSLASFLNPKWDHGRSNIPTRALFLCLSNLSKTEFEEITAFLGQMRYLRNEGDFLFRTSRTRQYYFENLSMIPDERRYQVIDVSTQQSVGILGEEFMMTKARIGTTLYSQRQGLADRADL